MHITRDEMTAHINAGHAQEWTQPLAGLIPAAAELHSTWHVILDGTNTYQPAPPPLADLLTHARSRLTSADTAITQADAEQHP